MIDDMSERRDIKREVISQNRNWTLFRNIDTKHSSDDLFYDWLEDDDLVFGHNGSIFNNVYDLFYSQIEKSHGNPFEKIQIKLYNINKIKKLYNSNNNNFINNEYSDIITVDKFNQNDGKKQINYNSFMHTMKKVNVNKNCYICDEEIEIEINDNNKININEDKNIFICQKGLQIFHINCLELEDLFKLTEKHSDKLLSNSL